MRNAFRTNTVLLALVTTSPTRVICPTRLPLNERLNKCLIVSYTKSQDTRWRAYNDSRVAVTDQVDVANAYLLFFQRRPTTTQKL